MKKIIWLALLFSLASTGNSQNYKFIPNQLIEIKDIAVYENLEFNNIKNFKKDSAVIADFAGQLLILDLWFKECTGCIAGFKKADTIQREYGTNIQFLLMTWDSEQKVRDHLSGPKAKLLPLISSPLPMIWSDSTAYFFFGIKTQPYLFFKIDESGRITRAWQGDLTKNIIDYCLGRKEHWEY